MALSTYAGLKAAIGSWNFNRATLPADDLVTLAEARLNRDLRLRAMETEAALTGIVGSRTIPLPADFLEPLALFIERPGQGRQGLRFVAAAMDDSAIAGEPRAWTIDAGALAFERPCDQPYGFTLRHLARFQLAATAPQDGSQSNWLLANWPDAYLAACNVEAALWLEEDDQALRWQTRYADALAAINAKESRSAALKTLSVDAALLPRAMGRGSAFDIRSGEP
jgi:hypothetical protein